MTLHDLLLAGGYHRLPLRTNAGLLCADGAVNGAPVTVLVDSGALATLVDTSIAEALGLMAQPPPAPGAPALLDGAALTLGGRSIRADVRAFSLGFLNGPLVARGGAPVQAVLGADALHAHRAVLDVPSASLYLHA